MILGYISVNLVVIVLRESRAQWYKPTYNSPLYPFLQVFGIVTGVLLLATMGKLAIFAILAIAIPGVILYLLYSRKKTTRKGVLGIRGKRHDLLQENPNPKTSDSNDVYSFDVSGDAQGRLL